MCKLHTKLVTLAIFAVVLLVSLYGRAHSIVGGVLVGGSLGPGSAGLNTVLVANYPLTAYIASCPAPCAVHFDASGSTTSDSLLTAREDLSYNFNFNDPNSTTWTNGTHAGSTKNTHCCGPWFMHTYEEAGTYTPAVYITDPNGVVASTTVTVTVADPNTTWSGANTICVNPLGDATFTGCPGTSNINIGAVGYGDWDDAMNTNWNTGRRLLFKAESYTANQGRTFNPGTGNPSMIGCYNSSGAGTSANPCVVAVSHTGSGDMMVDFSSVAGACTIPVGGDLHRNFRLVDHAFTGNAAHTSAHVIHWPCGQDDDILVLRVSTVGMGVAWEAGSASANTVANRIWLEDVTVGQNYYGAGTQWGTGMGCNYCGVFGGLFDEDVGSHQLRTFYGTGRIMAHNTFPPKVANGLLSNQLKFHAISEIEAGSGNRADFPELFPSHSFTISYNLFQRSSTDGNFSSLDVCPQNCGGSQAGYSDGEEIYEGIVEGNMIIGNPNDSAVVYRQIGHDIVLRNNVAALIGTDGDRFAFRVCGLTAGGDGACTDTGFAPLQAGQRNKAVNNTCYDSGAHRLTCVRLGAGHINNTANNNFLYGPSLLATDGSGNGAVVDDDGGTGVTSAGNVRLQNATHPFVGDGTYDEFVDFFLKPGDVNAKNAGAATNQSKCDAVGNRRPDSTLWDAGAFEQGGSPCP